MKYDVKPRPVALRNTSLQVLTEYDARPRFIYTATSLTYGAEYFGRMGIFSAPAKYGLPRYCGRQPPSQGR